MSNPINLLSRSTELFREQIKYINPDLVEALIKGGRFHYPTKLIEKVDRHVAENQTHMLLEKMRLQLKQSINSIKRNTEDQDASQIMENKAIELVKEIENYLTDEIWSKGSSNTPDSGLEIFISDMTTAGNDADNFEWQDIGDGTIIARKKTLTT